MQPDEPGGRWAWRAAAVWLLVLAAVGARAALQPRVHSVFATYAAAGGDWLSGSPLYKTRWAPHLDQYRYSPLVAVLLVPFHLMPEGAGNLVWRLLNGGALLLALAWWARAALPVSPGRRGLALLFLLVAPLTITSLNNGQLNPLVLALLLAAAAGVADGRWTVAALCVALATAMKVYPLAVGLLFVALYPRRFAPRLVLALALMAALPFLFQRFDYVVAQYAAWYERLRGGDEARRHWPAHMAYRDLWLLLRVGGVTITTRAYFGIQVATGVGCALLCLAGRRRWPRRELAHAALVLGCCWMMLCGPATESCTYILMAPVLAWALVEAGDRGGRAALCSVAGAAYGLLLIAVLAGAFGRSAAQQIHSLGLQPLGTLIFAAAYLRQTVRSLTIPTAPLTAEPAGRARAA